MELKVLQREQRFVDGLRWRLRDVLQQLQREESEVLSSLAPPLPAPVQTPTESMEVEAASAAGQELVNIRHAPASPRTPPLRPYLELDPMRLSGDPLMPLWRLDQECPPPEYSDSFAALNPSVVIAPTVGRDLQCATEKQHDFAMPAAVEPAVAVAQCVPSIHVDVNGSQPLEHLEETPSPSSESSEMPAVACTPDRLQLEGQRHCTKRQITLNGRRRTQRLEVPLPLSTQTPRRKRRLVMSPAHAKVASWAGGQRA